jgi:hypothetical protein
MTVIDVPLAEAVKVGRALTVNVVVPTDPAGEKNDPDAPE